MTDALTSDAAILDGSPAAATAALVEMTAKFNSVPAPPAAGALGARAQLDALSASPEWRAKFFGGDQGARKEFSTLTAQIAAGNPTAEAISAAPNPEEPFRIEVTIGNELNSRGRADAVAGLREIGLDDATVAQALDGAPVTAAERAMAQRYKDMRLGDADFTRRYLAGEWSARREMSLLAAILSSAEAA